MSSKNYQSEAELENSLIKQLETNGYEFVKIKDESALISNLKKQIEIHNKEKLEAFGKSEFSQDEFKRVLNILNKGGIFEKAEILRGKHNILLDSGEQIFFEFFNTEKWCQNTFQVTNQVSMEGKYKNRYDVTILINGLPVVQIELKRRGLALKESFNQINRYQRHSFSAGNGLFNYLQILISTNGVNTKYYSNNSKFDFSQTITWADVKNNPINNLEEFTDSFLEKCHLSKMIARYIILNQGDQILMVMRPYQCYAVESIINLVKDSSRNGYIWHTTGSGKTLTSFKASQILRTLDEVDQVVFVVDRKDLDDQTMKEYNKFKEGCIDGTSNTIDLVKQFKNSDKVIVTTIQKLNIAINSERYKKDMKTGKDKRVVFIFDECHRSQFGKSHKEIKNFFSNCQMIGFTGTPIFEENAMSDGAIKRTTKDLFGDCLHRYIITDAIRDDSVLRFNVEYWGKAVMKRDQSENALVEGINDREFLEGDQRVGKITDYVINHHKIKTKDKKYTAIFAINSVSLLRKYYDQFLERIEKDNLDLKIATIFSYNPNEEIQTETIKGEDGVSIEQEIDSNRESLERYIQHYNKTFGENYTSKDPDSYAEYYRNISKKVKAKKIDILFVVGMFLTGFDSKLVNTLYVDKNLQYHGLIQAFSRTNRTLGDKNFGNIVCFRNLKDKVDQAIKLFSDENANETILIGSMDSFVEKFKKTLAQLKIIAPTAGDVDKLIDEQEKLEFIKTFRKLINLDDTLKYFDEYDLSLTGMDFQDFEDYKSKYSDIYDDVKKLKKSKEKAPIYADIDFQLSLIHRDEINLSYILSLLGQANFNNPDEVEKVRKEIAKKLESNIKLRPKRDLILEFVNNYNLDNDSDYQKEWEGFFDAKKEAAFLELAQSTGLGKKGLKSILGDYGFRKKLPTIESVYIDPLPQDKKPGILKRQSFLDSVKEQISEFIEIYLD